MKVRFLYTGLVVLLSCCIIQLSNAKAQYTTPDALRAIENGSVYSFCQDLNGAIWMNTNYGLCRYNGKKVDYVYGQVPYNNISGNGKDLIYVPGISSILKFNIKDNSPVKLRGQTLIIREVSFLPMLTLYLLHPEIEFTLHRGRIHL